MNILELDNEQALDALADLVEPLTEIVSDKEFRQAFGEGNRAKAIANLIRNHKQSIIEMLAVVDGVPVSEYKCNILTLPVRVVELLNNEAIRTLFPFAETVQGVSFSSSATENTEESAQ